MLLALILAACGGHTARVASLDVEADRCGAWTATVDAKGRAQTLELLVDGQPAGSWAVDGRQTATATGQSAPGDRIDVLARIGDVQVTQAVDVPPVPVVLHVRAPEHVLAGKEPRVELHVDTPCDPSVYGWEAVVRQTGITKTGRFLGTGDGWVVLPTEAAGFYDVDVRVLGPSGELARSSVAYQVGG